MRWKQLVGVAIVADLLTLGFHYGRALVEGRLFGDPAFPHFLILHTPPPSCIVMRENFFLVAFALGVFWLVVVFAVGGMIRALLNLKGLPLKKVVVSWSAARLRV
jgi:hypothetical protein